MIEEVSNGAAFLLQPQIVDDAAWSWKKKKTRLLKQPRRRQATLLSKE